MVHSFQMQNTVDKQISEMKFECTIKLFQFRFYFCEINKYFTKVFFVGKRENIGRFVFSAIGTVEGARFGIAHKNQTEIIFFAQYLVGDSQKRKRW